MVKRYNRASASRVQQERADKAVVKESSYLTHASLGEDNRTHIASHSDGLAFCHVAQRLFQDSTHIGQRLPQSVTGLFNAGGDSGGWDWSRGWEGWW